MSLTAVGAKFFYKEIKMEIKAILKSGDDKSRSIILHNKGYRVKCVNLPIIEAGKRAEAVKYKSTVMSNNTKCDADVVLLDPDDDERYTLLGRAESPITMQRLDIYHDAKFKKIFVIPALDYIDADSDIDKGMIYRTWLSDVAHNIKTVNVDKPIDTSTHILHYPGFDFGRQVTFEPSNVVMGNQITPNVILTTMTVITFGEQKNVTDDKIQISKIVPVGFNKY